jgi:epoxyqueuosine reductase QueG
MEKNMYNEILKTINLAIIEYETSKQLSNFWKKPIMETISANNNKLSVLREIVSIEHLMPHDILPDAKSIICFFIPFQENIVKGNIEGTMASNDWSLAFIKTNELIDVINNKIIILMEQNGYKAGKIPYKTNIEKLLSNWSVRHIAYIAGLGTFGINNMIITKNGCCGRFGNIVVNYEFKEYKESKNIMEKCLNKLNGNCGICQKKCIINAYKNNNFNRYKCYEQCLKNNEYHKENGFSNVCGKCLVDLPCSIEEPKYYIG